MGQCVGAWVSAWVRGQFLKPEEGSYGHISEGFILAELYLFLKMSPVYVDVFHVEFNYILDIS